MSNYFSMEAFDYDDIQLIPNKGIIKSRRDADTSVRFGSRTFKIPVVPANMESVINDDLAVWLAENGYYYVMHRFEPEKRIPFIKMMHERASLLLFQSVLKIVNMILSTNWLSKTLSLNTSQSM